MKATGAAFLMTPKPQAVLVGAFLRQSSFGIFFIISSLISLSPAFAQKQGVVEGRVINGTDPTIIARGVSLEVIGLGGRMSIIASATTDSEGRFRIESLPASEPLIIRANYQGANYHGQAKFDASGRAYVEIKVFQTTDSMENIQAEGFRMTFQMVGDRLRAVEMVTLNNTTNPPKTYMNHEGNYRFSKLPGILEVPQIRITAPGSSMPLVQSALESADGKSYYSLYPLRPGVTTFEVMQILPYADRRYVFRKRFHWNIDSVDIGVIPQDMDLSGQGLTKVHADSPGNFAVYTSGPIKAGSEVVWTFSGGTATDEQESSVLSGESVIRAMPDSVQRNALIIGPLLLMGFVGVLWYAYNRLQKNTQIAGDFRKRRLKERREQMLDDIANLDYQYEARRLERQEYLRRREDRMRQLRRISMLIKKA
jgi:hypothetical protein